MMWIVNAVLLIMGALLCFRGLKLYKVLQFFLCGAVGAYLGLFIEGRLGMEELHFVAVLLAILAGYLGYRYYKFGLYLCGAGSSFVVVFSYFWKQALQVAKEGIGELQLAKEILLGGVTALVSGGDVEEAINILTGQSREVLMQSLESALAIVQKGLLWAGFAGVVVGILMMIFGDWIIILVTAALGGTIWIGFLENLVYLSPSYHLYALIAITVIGMIAQWNAKRNGG